MLAPAQRKVRIVAPAPVPTWRTRRLWVERRRAGIAIAIVIIMIRRMPRARRARRRIGRRRGSSVGGVDGRMRMEGAGRAAVEGACRRGEGREDFTVCGRSP